MKLSRSDFKLLFGFLFLCSLAEPLMGQAAKPTIMVVPSVDWCQANGFVKQVPNQGEVVILPQWEQAIINMPDLNTVMSKIGAEMSKDDFPLQSLSQTMKQIRQDRLESTTRGGTIGQNDIDVVRNYAKADIEMHLYWKIERQGPRSRVSDFRIVGIDTYTNKEIAAIDGSGQWVSSSNASDADLLREAVLSRMDGFKSALMNHFKDMFENGREISLYVYASSNWGKDFSTESYGDDELKFLISDWVARNSVKGRSGSKTYSDKEITFKGLRIPLFDENQQQMDATNYARGLKSYFRSLGIPSNEINIDGVGLGRVNVILGPKI
jgi:hypothetical protein